MSDDESSGTRQGVTCLIINTLGQEYDEWWVKCKTKLKKTLHSTPMPFKSFYVNYIHGCRVGVEWWRGVVQMLNVACIRNI